MAEGVSAKIEANRRKVRTVSGVLLKGLQLGLQRPPPPALLHGMAFNNAGRVGVLLVGGWYRA